MVLLLAAEVGTGDVPRVVARVEQATSVSHPPPAPAVRITMEHPHLPAMPSSPDMSVAMAAVAVQWPEAGGTRLPPTAGRTGRGLSPCSRARPLQAARPRVFVNLCCEVARDTGSEMTKTARQRWGVGAVMRHVPSQFRAAPVERGGSAWGTSLNGASRKQVLPPASRRVKVPALFLVCKYRIAEPGSPAGCPRRARNRARTASQWLHRAVSSVETRARFLSPHVHLVLVVNIEIF